MYDSLRYIHVYCMSSWKIVSEYTRGAKLHSIWGMTYHWRSHLDCKIKYIKKCHAESQCKIKYIKKCHAESQWQEVPCWKSVTKSAMLKVSDKKCHAESQWQKVPCWKSVTKSVMLKVSDKCFSQKVLSSRSCHGQVGDKLLFYSKRVIFQPQYISWE